MFVAIAGQYAIPWKLKPMATITGTLRGADNVASSWVLTFVPEDTPDVLGSQVVVGLDKRVVLEADGDLPPSVVLLGGKYTVQINNGEEFRILVPASGGPYDIKDLFVSEDAEATPPVIGLVDPEGVVTQPEGKYYFNKTNSSFWVKRTGSGNTGWQQLLG